MTECLAATVSTVLIFGWQITIFIPATWYWDIHCTGNFFYLCWMGLVAGQQALLLVEPCQETALDKPEDFRVKGGCVQYCSPSLVSHTLSSGNMGLLVWTSPKACSQPVRTTFSFTDSENKSEDAMKSCKVSTTAPRAKAGSTSL